MASPPPTTFVFRGSSDQLRAILHRLPAILAGRVPDPGGVVRAMQLRMGNAWLSQVYQDFLVKSRGGTGRDGIKWPPLDPKTTAARKRSKSSVAEFNRAKKRDPKLTKLAFYGARKADIGIDTARMVRSLTAGYEDQPAASPDQVLKLGRGELIIGSNVPYTGAFHRGRPGRQPPRPITPLNGRIPDAYQPALALAMNRGILTVLAYLLRGGR